LFLLPQAKSPSARPLNVNNMHFGALAVSLGYQYMIFADTTQVTGNGYDISSKDNQDF